MDDGSCITGGYDYDSDGNKVTDGTGQYDECGVCGGDGPDENYDCGGVCDTAVAVDLWGDCYNIESTTSLDLQSIGLSGPIPTEIGQLINLVSINLSHNLLDSSIPVSICNLSSLTSLNLLQNNLESIPSCISELTELTELILAYNNLGGNLPENIFDLQNLTILNLGTNYGLSGEIGNIGNLIHLQEFSVFNNIFNGTIPESIDNLTELTEFDLRNNNFSGSIPESICNLVSSNFSPELNLANNQFCPPYPTCLIDNEDVNLNAQYINLCPVSVSVEIQNVNTEAGTLDIYMENDVPIENFQFQLSDITITDAYGGSAESSGLIVITASDKIMGFTVTESTIPAGNGILLEISFSDYMGGNICFDNTDSIENIFSSAGSQIIMEWGDCYDPTYCYSGIYDCEGICDGPSTIDVCGVCAGGAIDMNECPDISVDPQLILTEIVSGEIDSTSSVLTIANQGGNDLEWDLKIQDNRSSSNGRNIGFYADETRIAAGDQLPTVNYGTDTGRDKGEVLAEYGAPNPNGATGMAWVGEDLYILSYYDNEIRKVNPLTGEVVSFFPLSPYDSISPCGMVWDGQYLWVGDHNGNIYGYDLEGNLVGSFSAPVFTYIIIAWDGEHFLLTMLGGNGYIYKMDHSGNIIDSYSTYLLNPISIMGMFWVPSHEGGNLWVLDGFDNLARLDLYGTWPNGSTTDGYVSLIDQISLDYNSSVYAISHDKTDLWILHWNSPYLQIDDGIVEPGEWLSANPASGTIPAGSEDQIELKFDATYTYAGDYSNNIVISSNDPDDEEITVSVDMSVSGEPSISVDSALEYGEAFVASRDTSFLTISNVGTDILQISDIVSDNGYFTVDITSLSLDPGDETVLDIIFSPTATGYQEGTLTITSNDPVNQEASVLLNGTGIIPPDIAVTPSSLSTALESGEIDASQVIIIANNGGSDLEWVYDGNEVWFSLDYNYGTIPAGSSDSIDAYLDATGKNGGDYSTNIVIISNDPDESEVIVSAEMSVTGVPNIVIESESIDYGEVFTDQPVIVEPEISGGSNYEVYGGNFTISGDAAYHPGDYGYTLLGSDSTTQAFWGSYQYYCIVTQPGNIAPIDAVESSNGTYFPGYSHGGTILWAWTFIGELDGNVSYVGGANGGENGGYMLYQTDEESSYIIVHFVHGDNSRFLPIYNNGTDILNVTDIQSTNPVFSVSDSTFSVAPDNGNVLEIIFTPIVDGFEQGMITFITNDSQNPAVQIDLQGTGLVASDIAISNTESIYMELYNGGIDSSQITITNEGEYDLEFQIHSGWDLGEVIDSLPSPGSRPVGITWDGQYLWVAHSNDYEMIFQIDPADGSGGNIIYSNQAQGNHHHLTWDGTHLWGADDHGSYEITKFDPSNGNIIDQFSLTNSIKGLVWAGDSLWMIDDIDQYAVGDEVLVNIDPSGNILAQQPILSINGYASGGLAWDGEYLWYSYFNYDSSADFIYKVDLSGSGEVLQKVPLPNFSNDLAWDGQFMWITSIDEDMLYQINVDYYFASTNLQSGTLSAGDSTNISVIFDAADMEGGYHFSDISITSNDPDESEITIPVIMNIRYPGCMDASACNYNADATEEDGSCEYPGSETFPGCDCAGNVLDCEDVCGGTAVVDDCSICNGDNTSCADCIGLPNGTAMVDDCGECIEDGEYLEDNAPNPAWNACQVEHFCDTSVCLFIENIDTNSGTLDIYMINNEPVAGYQFELLGITITGGSGGTSEAAGFEYYVSNDGSFAYGFDMQANTIPLGEGVLTQIAFINWQGASICFGTDPMENVIADQTGSSLQSGWGDCYFPLSNCMDETACNYNEDATVDDGSCLFNDACGICGGDGSDCLDCAGVPGGSAVMQTYCFDTDAIFQDDFESYTAGEYINQSSEMWHVWDSTYIDIYDAMIIDTLALSGGQSLLINEGNSILLPLGDKTMGKYSVSFNYYVPTGHEAYYSLYHVAYPDSSVKERAIRVYFNENNGYIKAGNIYTYFDYNHDEWIYIENIIDLDADVAEMRINGALIHSWTWSWTDNSDESGTKQLGALNLGGTSADQYIVDNVLFGDGLGTPTTQAGYCSASVDGGYVSDCSDVEFACVTNDIDDCGVCGGDGTTCVCESKACIYIANVDTTAGLLNIWINNTESIGGYQITMSGINIKGVYGGLTETASFSTAYSNSTLIAFSLTGASIPSSSGNLLTVEFSDYFSSNAICIDEITMSDSYGNLIIPSISGCFCPGDQLADGCGVCGGNGVMQACGCGAPGEYGMPEDKCDCDGNIADECGVCGGNGVSYECWDLSLVCTVEQCPETPSNYPYWPDNPGGYEYTALMSSLVYIDNEVTGEGGDLLGAFDTENNLRGVSSWIQLPEWSSFYPGFMFLMVLRSNTEGDVLSFKFYDASEDTTFNITENYDFISGDIIGSIDYPNMLNVFTCSGSNCFQYIQSSQQAFYYFQEVSINGVPIASDDWVGAFNGDICVGARQWNTTVCGGGVCDMPVMGYDGNSITYGYMNPGEIPSFKIYDTSEDAYYDAQPSDNIPWYNLSQHIITSLSTSPIIYGCTDAAACNYEPYATDSLNCQFAEISCILDNYQSVHGSQQQAVYLFSHVTIGGDTLAADDWVGAFKEDICVGATSECNNVACGMQVMGDDSTPFTDGYMLTGENPFFKIYDASHDVEYIAIPSESTPWDTDIFFIDSLQVNGGCTDLNACNYEPDLSFDDGSCWNIGDSNCGIDGEIICCDCNGNIEDDCGVCGGDNSSCWGCKDHNFDNYDVNASIPCSPNGIVNGCCISEDNLIGSWSIERYTSSYDNNAQVCSDDWTLVEVQDAPQEMDWYVYDNSTSLIIQKLIFEYWDSYSHIDNTISSSSVCDAAGGYWSNNACSIILNQENCGGYGGTWISNEWLGGYCQMSISEYICDGLSEIYDSGQTSMNHEYNSDAETCIIFFYIPLSHWYIDATGLCYEFEDRSSPSLTDMFGKGDRELTCLPIEYYDSQQDTLTANTIEQSENTLECRYVKFYNHDSDNLPNIGCTNPDADNYDSNAELDDGSCDIMGCMDAASGNYDPSATTDCDDCCLAQFTRIVNDIVNDGGTSKGVSWGDYDNDGDLDIFIANMPGLNFLYKNNGSGTFVDTGFDLLGISENGNSGVWGDYNNDGYLDLLILRNGHNIFYTNQEGSDLSPNQGPIYEDDEESRGGSWVDYDNDGWLDVFVVNNGNNSLYHNDGYGSFTKITDGDIVNDGGNSNEASWADYDSDGDMDVFVANDNDENNFLYQNNGDGSFTNISVGNIVKDGGHTKGGSWADYDNDGDLDLFVVNSDSRNKLYNNDGNGSFIEYSGFYEFGYSNGSSWADYDNDGDLDLFVANFNDEDNLLYENDGGNFTQVTEGDNINDGGYSQGASWGDYDNDGDLDQIIVNSGLNQFYRNNQDNINWINITLEGSCEIYGCTNTNRSAIGSKITIHTENIKQFREISSQTGYGTQNSLNIEFGLGEYNTIDSLTIQWSSGNMATIYNIESNQFITYIEGSEECLEDCAGECGGSSVVDECGTCDSDTSNDCVQDCAGVFGGLSVVDECGTCDSDALNDCLQDCAGTFGGSSVIDECGVCGGDNACYIPTHSMPSITILPVYVDSIDIQFSIDLDPTSIDGINLTSTIAQNNDPGNIVFGKDGDNSIIQIILDNPVPGDQIDITIIADLIKSAVHPEITMNQNDILTYKVAYLGDYNNSGYEDDGNILDSKDVDSLTRYWAKEDYRYELGPCVEGSCLAADYPHLIPAFQFDESGPYIDKHWGIEDLMSFMVMWNGQTASRNAMSRSHIEETGESAVLEFDKNTLIMDLPEYDQHINHIWFRIELPSKKVSYEPADFESNFDLAPSRISEDESQQEWSLIDLDGDESIDKLVLGVFVPDGRDNQLVDFQYKVTSMGSILSSGSIVFVYTPIPDDYELNRAYPNPFNPRTNIRYSLPVDAEITISIYDIQGRLITYLEDGIKQAGYYELVWDGSWYASGLYFIRMEVYDTYNTLKFQKLQKIMLMK